MNSIRAINFFTLVLIFMTGVSVQAGRYGSFDECMRRYSAPESECSQYRTNNSCPPPVPGQAAPYCDPLAAYRECMDRKKTSFCDRDNPSDVSSDCKDLYRQYQDQNRNTAQECAKYGQPSVGTCVAKAQSCGAYMDSSGGQNDPVAALQNLVGAYASMQNPNSQGGGCFIDDDGSEESRKERIDQQVESLKEQNAESVSKQAELDDELNKKKEEVDKEIAELEADVNKKKVERQTKLQEEQTRIQKAELKSTTKKFENLTKISKLDIDIANLQFAQQQIAIEFADARITKTCGDKVAAMQAQLTGGSVPPGAPPGTKPVAKKFTVKEVQKIKADLKLEESSCLQTEVLKRSAQIKGLLDKRTGLQSQVDTLKRANEDEDKAILIEKQAIEAMKESMTKEEQNDLDNKFKKQNILSASVAKYSETVDKKKKAIDAKIAAREKRIQDLLLAKQNVKKKYATISASLGTRQEAQSTYLNQCCGSGSTDKNCKMVKSDFNNNRYTAPSGGGIN